MSVYTSELIKRRKVKTTSRWGETWNVDTVIHFNFPVYDLLPYLFDFTIPPVTHSYLLDVYQY